MSTKWDTLDIDREASGLDLQQIMSREHTEEELLLYCDKNFPYLHIANADDPPDPDLPVTLTREQLPCGWQVFHYHQGDHCVLMMTSRFAGRPDSPMFMHVPEVVRRTPKGQDDGGEGGGASELDWQAMSRLAAAQMIDFLVEQGVMHASVTAGTRHMVESAYVVAKSQPSLTLETDLDEADEKRLDSRARHLAEAYKKETDTEPSKRKR